MLLSAYANSPGHAQLQPDPGAENAEAYQAVLDDLESHRIDLNSAAMGNLESLPSLDRTIAIRMVKRRKPFGKYRSLGDLTGISGITTGTLDLLRPYLEIHTRGQPDSRVQLRVTKPSGESTTWLGLRIYQQSQFRTP